MPASASRSYRAEVRALLDAICWARTPICIFSNCKTEVNVLAGILQHGGGKVTWPRDDDCLDLWEWIAEHVREYLPGFVEVCWMPGHLDDPKKAEARRCYLLAGGQSERIQGNVEADKLAKRGASAAAPPPSLLWREHLQVLLAMTPPWATSQMTCLV